LLNTFAGSAIGVNKIWKSINSRWLRKNLTCP
jgi:hypothetical protein